MAFATTTALLLAGAAAAGGQAAGSAIAAHGAKDAAKTQAQAGQEALTYLQGKDAQMRADLAPYREVGGAAMTTLGGLMGLGGGGGAGAPGGGGTGPTGGLSTVARGDVAGAGWPPTRINPYSGEAQQAAGTGREAWNVREGANGSGYVPATAGAKWYPTGGEMSAPQTVLMQAPDGTQQDVPASQVAHYQARGAQIVRG